MNYKYLKQNKARFAANGLPKNVWSPLSAKDFGQIKKDEFVSPNKDWNTNGFLKLESFFSSDFVDKLNSSIDEAIEAKIIDFNYTQKKILFAYEQLPILKEVINNPQINEMLQALVGEEIVPFQSINFLMGSEQRAHSDSVHMATYPEGGLIAIWVALEDVDEKNGGLFYYPESHKLPYASNAMIGNATGWLLSPNPNKNYEDYLEKELAKLNLKKEVFTAKTGDVLVWHANLVHGGLPHIDKTRTRKSMVVHYFVKNRICYHELSQRPAIVKPIL